MSYTLDDLRAEIAQVRREQEELARFTITTILAAAAADNPSVTTAHITAVANATVDRALLQASL